jgi:PAS domain S-box-containing protein
MSREPAKALRIVLLEDDPNDAELIQLELARDRPDVAWRHVATEASFREAIEPPPDLVLADYSLPGFDGLTALSILRSRHPDVPFIFVSGSLGEERATEALKSGATDYVLKDRLQRLPAVVHRALAEAHERQERRKAQSALEDQRILLGTLIDNLPVIVFAADSEQKLTVVNRALLYLINRPRDAVVGHRTSEFPELARLTVSDVSSPATTGPGSMLDYHEVAWENQDGTLRWFISSQLPLHDATTGALVGSVSTSRDITAFKELTRELLEISNREQQRLGSDLHDGLGQELTGLSLLLRGLEVQLTHEAPAYLPQVTRIRELVAHTIQSARLLARGLAPVNLERGGLPEALRHLAQRCIDTYGLECIFENIGQPLPDLNESAATHLFRIAQEATTNAARYAHATRLNVLLETTPRKLRLAITDNGIGLAAGLERSRPGMGLKIMEYRARMMGAKVAFEEVRPGTRVTVTCPLQLVLHGDSVLSRPGTSRSRIAKK